MQFIRVLASAGRKFLLGSAIGIVLSSGAGAGLPAQLPHGAFPAAVALSRGTNLSEFFCSGVLIHPNWVLTAAYCLGEELGEKPVYVHTIRSLVERAETRFRELAPAGTRDTFQTLGLVRLAQPIEKIPPAELAKQSIESLIRSRSKKSAQTGMVVGWGITSAQQRIVPAPKYLPVVPLSLAECNSPTMYQGKVPSNQFCAKSQTPGVDACGGFGGAPLVLYNEDGIPLVHGIVMWGEGCGKLPTVYTDVSAGLNWIRETTRGEAGG